MSETQRQVLERIYWAGVKAVVPYDRVRQSLSEHLHMLKDRPMYVIAFGKAACPMVLAVEDLLGPDTIKEGIAITKYGHIPERQPAKVRIFEAAHPVPDRAALEATQKVLEMAKGTEPDALCLCLISGGGSALLVCPAEGLNLQDKQITTELLLRAGADIFELNSVRKHLSCIKGGRLSEALYPSEVLSLILSDVLGDKIDVIASGPTAPDSTTYSDAYEVLKKYDLLQEVPAAVLEHIQKGINGQLPETPDTSSPALQKTTNLIIGNLHMAIAAARAEAESLGFKTETISETLQGEAIEVARFLARKAKETKGPKILLSGGETTVTVKGPGRGGRNMELALAFAIEVKDTTGITLLSAGTDGTDGPTDAAGAVVDSGTYQRATRLGLSPESYLQNNDSYTFFQQTGELFITGPTGTNVMDLQIILVQ